MKAKRKLILVPFLSLVLPAGLQAAGLPERPTGAVANNGDGGVVGKVREAST